MSVEETVREYYETLRNGDPLYPFFARRDDVVKFGIEERLTGFDAVREGLESQTRTTEAWRVTSHALLASRRGDVGWFSDDVDLAWTDRDAGERRSFETRWSGTLERSAGEWQFVGVHVSAPHEL